MPQQIIEAARQIMNHASDIHEALATAGRQEEAFQALKIHKKAACIIRMQRTPEMVVAGYRNDMLSGIGVLAATIEHYERDWETIDDEGLITIVRVAEQMMNRVEQYFQAKKEE
jgi:hypothetical protein